MAIRPWIVACLMVAALPALAHEDHTHGKARDTVHRVDSGHHHLDVVFKDGTLSVLVTGEDGKPEDTAGAKAVAVVLSGGATSQVILEPAGDNMLTAKGPVAAAPGAVVVLTLTMPGHAPEQSRLTLD